MKLSGEPKVGTEGATNEGNYDEAQLEEMLEHYVEAKKIDADPKLKAVLRNFAMSKNKQVEEIFGPNASDSPKSLKDLKATYNEKVMEDDEE